MHAKIMRMTFSTMRPVPILEATRCTFLSAAASEIPSIPTKWKTANMALQTVLHCRGIPRAYQALPIPDSFSLSLSPFPPSKVPCSNVATQILCESIAVR